MSSQRSVQTNAAKRARQKFLRIFPGGFTDEDYVDLERSYKLKAHLAWKEALSKNVYADLLRSGQFKQIATAALRIESRTNLLFSFEKIALRDAVRTRASAKIFAEGLFDLLYSRKSLAKRFAAWVDVVAALPRYQTRVLTWPVVTVFGFIARPDEFFFFKPTVTREAAQQYGFDLPYKSRPSCEIYEGLLQFVHIVRSDLRDLKPRDMIDLQSFLWIQGSEEYAD